jgi:hypothetical protein
MAFPYVRVNWADGPVGGTPVSAANLNLMDAAIALASVAGFSSSPPGSPTDGMIWRPKPQAGVFWKFMYDSSEGTYKWVFVGGGPMYSVSETDGSWNNTSYVDPTTTPAASLTIPRAGVYEITFGATVAIAVADMEMRVAVKLGSAATSSDDSASTISPNSSGRDQTMHRTIIRTLSASDVVKLQYKSAGATGTSTLRAHWLYVRPVQVS